VCHVLIHPGRARCGRRLSPHHNPFEYYVSTANPDHTPPASVAEIGRGGPANHEYDLSWFGKALDTGNLPAVSYLKASEYQDGHPGYSDPTDEQTFLVNIEDNWLGGQRISSTSYDNLAGS
jgi:phospholipase C